MSDAIPRRFGLARSLAGSVAIRWAFFVALGLLGLSAVVSYRSTAGFIESARWVDHTNEMRVGIERFETSYYRIHIPWRNALLRGEAADFAEFTEESQSLLLAIENLKRLTRDTAAHQVRLNALERLVTEDITALSGSVSRKLAGKIDDPISEILRVTMRDLHRYEVEQLIFDIRSEEEHLLASRRREWSETARRAVVAIIASSLSGFAMLIAVFVLLRRENRIRRAAQQEAQRRTVQLEAANRELESFSYSVSHDLRSPLRAIDGFARIFEEDYADRLDEEGKRLLRVIRDNSRRMGQLIDDLLAFSRLGRKPLAVSTIDMTEQVKTVFGEITNGDHRARLQLEPLPQARGDPALVRQVWQNLLANAVKFSGRRPDPLVTVTGHSDGAENVYCVRDNGVGFDMRYYDKLFGVFQRLHDPEEYPGTGVGLAIVQRVVARHGGRVWAEGEEGRGAAFYFTLPGGADDG